MASNFGVKAIIVVGDRGMLKQTEIGLLNEERFHYITVITKPQIKKLIREGAFQLDTFEEKLCEVEVDGVRYILRRNAERAKEVARNREGKLNGVRKLLNRKNLYLAERRGARIEVARREVEEKARQLEIDAWVKVVSQGRILELVIDEAVRREKAELDGCYVINTDVPAEVATAETIHDRYKDLAWVERASGTFKSGHLEIRPIFVRTEASTRGHVFVVMLAYLLERELDKYWQDLEVTVAEGIDELGSLRGVEISVDKVTCQKVPEVSGLSKQLLDAANITSPDMLPLRKVHVATRKKLVSQRNLN